ncbi:MAG: hypothetical protein QGD94_12905, partial [Planctomycetia bacterium]|nr:hypothetical protein [Planctomycetia bacterium]
MVWTLDGAALSPTIRRCPFCDDAAHHLGVFRERGNFNCFRCGETGGLYKLLKALLGLSWRQFERIMDGRRMSKQSATEQIKNILSGKKEEDNAPAKTKSKFPQGCQEISAYEERNPELLQRFLGKRNLQLYDVFDRGCRVGISGEYMHRLVVPVYDKVSKMVGFQGRDMTGRARLKYKTPFGFNIKEHLYGIEGVDKTMVVTEGVFDAWRLGPASVVCTFGCSLSTTQR